MSDFKVGEIIRITNDKLNPSDVGKIGKIVNIELSYVLFPYEVHFIDENGTDLYNYDDTETYSFVNPTQIEYA